ncbi:MAG: toll/interleukin-1 receptor domain-containing protein [Pseudomonadota bacterium]
MSIFISYRRSDSSGYAQALYSELARSVGDDRVFMDVDGIHPGEDFSAVIDTTLRDCRVVLVLIGRSWLEAAGVEGGQRRIDNPDDFVRQEIAAALASDRLVIPLLFDGATMPAADELPASIAALSKRNAVAIRHDRFRDDVAYLLKTINKASTALRDPKEAWTAWIATAVVVTIVVIGLIVIAR